MRQTFFVISMRLRSDVSGTLDYTYGNVLCTYISMHTSTSIAIYAKRQ